jgi:chromosome partitioning protein
MPLSDCIQPTGIPNLDIVPATVDLSGAEVELVSVDNRVLPGFVTARAQGHESVYRLPHHWLLTLNAWRCRPTGCHCEVLSCFALEGLSQLLYRRAGPATI